MRYGDAHVSSRRARSSGARRVAPGRAVAIAVVLLAIGGMTASGCGGGAGSSVRTSHRSGSASAANGSASALVQRGRSLYQSDGCAGCHSLDGTGMTGPTWKGLAGSTVTLSDGRTLVATDAYLARHIVDPSAYTVRGYAAGVMAPAIEALELSRKPADVRALVAFIDSLR